eukprot:Skav221362  [mRNA]  locus=scaffold2286:51833:53251:+ [translate_table: standard]
MLTRGWRRKVCSLVQSRKNFNLKHFDSAAFPQILKRLPEAYRTDAINYVTGKHVTNDALGHYVCIGNFACPLCDGCDSRAHRIYECPALQSIRDTHGDVIHWLRSQPDAVTHFGILPWDEQWLDFACCEYTPFPAALRPAPTCVGERHHVFTDGSASFTECPSATICAGAWLHADGITVIRSGGSVLEGADHSAYRGEVWAVVLALQHHYYMTLYTDCAAVVSVLQHLISARLTGSQPTFGDHEDLWCIAWELLLTRPVGCVEVQKVKSHQTPASLIDLHERWKADMNNRVDKLAKDLVRRFCVGYTRRLQQHCKTLIFKRNMLQQFYMMWGSMNERAMQLVKERAPSRCGVMPHFSENIDTAQLVQLDCVVPLNALQHCLYGRLFMERVIEYFSELEWDFTKPAVSLLELYADFSLATGTLTPVLLTRASLGLTAGPKVYRLRDQCMVADMAASHQVASANMATLPLVWTQ